MCVVVCDVYCKPNIGGSNVLLVVNLSGTDILFIVFNVNGGDVFIAYLSGSDVVFIVALY